MKQILLFFTLLGVFASCGGNTSGGSGSGEAPKPISFGGVTLTVSHRNVTESDVEFYGRVDFEESYSNAEFGIAYSTSPDFTIDDAEKLLITNVSGTDYSVSASWLTPGTTYYYASFIKKTNLYKCSEVASFKTVSLVAPASNAVSDITEISATIRGKVTFAQSTAEYGFYYSKSEDFSSDVERKWISDMDAEGNYSIQISFLAPSQVYYIRSYVKKNGVEVYGEVSSFKTASIVPPALNDASNIKEFSATISGKVSIPSTTPDDFYGYEYKHRLEFGVEYCTSQDFTSNVTTKKVTTLDSENNFSVKLSSLISNQAYYYRSYIIMRGVTVYSEPKSFTTLPGPYDIQKDLNISSATDLSSSGSANCYIVSESGTYKFKTVKGNSSTSVDSVASASVLWETFGTSETPEYLDLIKSFCYKDGYIVFQTADTFKEGNAVIAAKDASGTILWSWHIWFTDQPQGQEYYNNAGTMMDRNLGATSATPGDVGALGLLYQWGRKDPFLGSSSIRDNVRAKSTISWPSEVYSTSSTGTISYATAHPMTFIAYNSSNDDWYYTGSSSTDNTRWTTSSSAKSIYDPCPVGWRVPDGGDNGVWSKANGSSIFSPTYSGSNAGMDFSGRFGSASTIWYPASGSSGIYSGRLYDVGSNGYYWSASPDGNDAYDLRFDYDSDVYRSISTSRARNLSVRCIQE